MAVWSWRGTRIFPAGLKPPAAVAIIVKVIALEAPPPGAGLNTVTSALPEAAMSLARIWAVSIVELTNVVPRGAPFQRISEAVTNPAPFTVKIKSEPPAGTEVGATEVIDGCGFCDGGFCGGGVPA